MKKRIYFTVAVIATMLLASCKQPVKEGKEASIVLAKDQIFLNPSPSMARSSQKVIQITTSKNIVLPLTVSDYDPTLMTATISDDNQTITITALKDSTQQIFVTDQSANKSNPLTVVVNSLDLELSLAVPSSTVKVGNTIELAISRGNDIGTLSVSSSDHLRTSLSDSIIKVEALKDGMASITITDGVVSDKITFQVEPLDKSLSISPQESSLKVDQSRYYTIHQGVDGGNLVSDIKNDGVVQVESITEKVLRSTELKNDKEFKITGLKAGTAKVTLTDESDPSITVTATITVQSLDTTLELDAPDTVIATTKTANVAVKRGEDINSNDLVIKSSNTAVATAQFSSNRESVIVTGKSVGKTTITISDPKSNASHAVEMTVRALDLKLSIQNAGPVTLIDQTGNNSSQNSYAINQGLDIEGPFTVVGGNTNIVSISLNNNQVSISATGRGSTSFTIKDKNGVESNAVDVSVIDVVLTPPTERIQVKVGQRLTFDIVVTGEDAIDMNKFAYQLRPGDQSISTLAIADSANNIATNPRILTVTVTGVSVGTNNIQIFSRIPPSGANGPRLLFYEFDTIPAD